MKVKFLYSTFVKGKPVEKDTILDVTPKEADELVRLGCAVPEKLDGLIEVRILHADELEGFRRGEVVELPARGAVFMVSKNKATFDIDSKIVSVFEQKSEEPTIEVVILENTMAEGKPLEQGKIYALKSSVIRELSLYGLVSYPDDVEQIKVRVKAETVCKGLYCKPGEELVFSIEDAKRLISKGYAEPIGVIRKGEPVPEKKKSSLAFWK
jgi:hypothetical protein